ncbi:HET-domain-containing protein [Apiospora rasikravindrae]|uniref:HET-domain-containing protein n=1 Tax=Apiospora rasikravindrae TaxID=990691 RepID=A0ABR1S2U3_9PEZI
MEVDEDNADFYRPLDIESLEFRLLLLQAGEGDEPIKCQLVHASLKEGADRPSYETISYCWGDPAQTAGIFVDGLEMEVPLSARRVLQRMRKYDADRTLWIDAICINQNDVAERGQQVALIKDIYSKTEQCLIWLGEGDGEATTYCDAVFDSVYGHAEHVTSNLADSDEIAFKTLTDNGLGGPLLKQHIITFFSSPWFERAWVIQEALLAPRSLVHIGSHEIDLEKLLLSAAWLAHVSSTMDLCPLDKHVGLLNCKRMYDLGHSADDDKSIDDILDKLQTFRAADPRDYVYGILGLYQKLAGLEGGPLPALLAPDYSKSVAAVMRDTSRHVIEQSPNLDFLGRLRHRPGTAYEATGVPSWAEPWHMRSSNSDGPPSQGTAANDMKCNLYAADNAVGKREIAVTVATLNYDPDVLVLTGVIAGKVKDTSCVINGDPKQFAHLLESADSPIYLESIRESPETIGFALIAEATTTSERPMAEYARTNVLAWADFIVKQKERPREANKRLGAKNPYSQTPDGMKADFTEEEWAALVDYDDAVRLATQDRRVFRTEAENIGLGPRDMVAGDVVAVLYGCRWPVILRPRGDVEVEGYEFIEVCYVYGLMDGEAVQRHMASGQNDVIFHLK